MFYFMMQVSHFITFLELQILTFFKHQKSIISYINESTKMWKISSPSIKICNSGKFKL